MDVLVYCRNIAALFNIFICLGRLLEGLQVHRESNIQRLHDTCNLFQLNYEGTDQHSHMEMVSHKSSMSDDGLYQLCLRLMTFPEIITTGQYFACLDSGESYLCYG